MKVFKLALSLPLLLIGSAFVYFTYLVFSLEVLPTLLQGTLNISTDVMILDYLWRGNQIYILLFAYGLTALLSYYAAYRLVKSR